MNISITAVLSIFICIFYVNYIRDYNKQSEQEYQKMVVEYNNNYHKLINSYSNIVYFPESKVVMFTKKPISAQELHQISCGKNVKLNDNQIIIQYKTEYDNFVSYKILTEYHLTEYKKVQNKKTTQWIKDIGLKNS